MDKVADDLALIVDQTAELADIASTEYGWTSTLVDGIRCWRDGEGRLVRFAETIAQVRALPRGAILYVGCNPYVRSDYELMVGAARHQGVAVCRTIAKTSRAGSRQAA